MALSDLTSPDAVLKALAEYDALGRDQFLARYGFGKARSYFLIKDGRSYDSKAVAGAAHQYQFPDRGPLRAGDFSGGDQTVKRQLEALGFDVVVTEPRTGEVPPLRLFDDYSRRDVHDLFDPDSNFTPGAGTWGIAGIIEHQPSEFVFFVTFGQEQGGHEFDEGITSEGVLAWQSQPNQSREDEQIQRLLKHDSQRSNVRLFLRTSEKMKGGAIRPYTYLGGSPRQIEVKTTRGSATTSFFISSNEVAFSELHTTTFRLYRLFNFDSESGSRDFYVLRGALTALPSLQLEGIQFLARLI